MSQSCQDQSGFDCMKREIKLFEWKYTCIVFGALFSQIVKIGYVKKHADYIKQIACSALYMTHK